MARPEASMQRMKRFYAAVDVAPVNGGFAVRLDGRTPKSPEGRSLIVPTEALGSLVAAEWAAQGSEIAPASMPATRLAWASLALAEHDPSETAAMLAAYAGSDLVCYFADYPTSLVARQEAEWGPQIAWAEQALGVTFKRAKGIMHQAQPEATTERIAVVALKEPTFALAGLAQAASLFGSAILAFALRRGHLTGKDAFALSRLDEEFQEERWGVDQEAAARTAGMAIEAAMLEHWFAAL